MKKSVMAALLLASAFGTAQAGGSASASFDVSFVIRAACTVQLDASAPLVECSKGTGYQVVRPVKDEAVTQAPSSAAQVGDAWQIVF